MGIWFVYIGTWPAATRVLSRGRERTLGTRLGDRITRLDLLVDWPISGTDCDFSGTRLVRKSAQGLFSPWNKLSRQKCRSPENIASSRLVAPGSPRMRIYVVCANNWPVVSFTSLKWIWPWWPGRKALSFWERTPIVVPNVLTWLIFQDIRLGKWKEYWLRTEWTPALSLTTANQAESSFQPISLRPFIPPRISADWMSKRLAFSCMIVLVLVSFIMYSVMVREGFWSLFYNWFL